MAPGGAGGSLVPGGVPVSGPAALRATLLRLLGPEVAELLADRSVTELYTVEGHPELWVDDAQGRHPAGIPFPPERVQMFLNAVASGAGIDFGPAAPRLAADLPEGLGRLQGFLPPLAVQPLFILRRPAPEVLPLAAWVDAGLVPAAVAEELTRSLAEHETILVVGGTATGKTTFLNSLLHELARVVPAERIALLEDTPELVCSSRDHIHLRTLPGLTLYDLLDAILRASPRRIVVGEVRDHAALAMLDAWNTGHPGGLATLHANTCSDALLRLGTLVQRANVPPQSELIAATVSRIVRLEGTTRATRHVAELVVVEGFDPAERRFLLHPLFRRSTP